MVCSLLALISLSAAEVESEVFLTADDAAVAEDGVPPRFRLVDADPPELVTEDEFPTPSLAGPAADLTPDVDTDADAASNADPNDLPPGVHVDFC